MDVKTTEYFQRRVLKERPEIDLSWCQLAITRPIRREVQPQDGRIRHWVYIKETGKYLRVITLADGETLHNAFFDRRFKP